MLGFVPPHAGKQTGALIEWAAQGPRDAILKALGAAAAVQLALTGMRSQLYRGPICVCHRQILCSWEFYSGRTPPMRVGEFARHMPALHPVELA